MAPTRDRCQYKEKGLFTLNPEIPGHFQQLLQAVPDIEGIIHLWSIDVPPTQTSADLEDAAFLSLGSTLHLVQSLIKKYTELPRLWLVTRGAQPVGKKGAVPGIAQSQLWGMRKAIALEFPELQCTIVDLDPEPHSSTDAQTLEAQIFSQETEDQVAFRNGTRYVPRLVPRPHEEKNTLALDANSTYLITGGLGGLGLRVAGAIAQWGGKNIVLVGRSEPKPEVKERLKELETAGVKVTIARTDVSDTQQVTDLLAQIDGTLPPLRGIVHAAGVVEFCGLCSMPLGSAIRTTREASKQDWTHFARVLAPKVQGTWNLHSLTKDIPLDFFVCFSSLASLLGSHGLASYGAANEFMDALMHYRREQGLPGLSINWGPWAEAGMASNLGSDHQQRLSAWGLSEIVPDRGLAVLEQLLQLDTPQVGVMPVDWSKWLQQFPVARASSPAVPPFYDRLPISDPQEAIDLSPEIDLASELRATPVKERRDRLSSHLQKLVAKSLGLKDASQIGLDAQLMDLGLDSLMAMELRNDLQSSLGCSIGSTFLFKYPTLAELLDYVDSVIASEAKQSPKLPSINTASMNPPPAIQQSQESIGDRSTVVPIKPEGSQPPWFFVSGILGSVFDLYLLAKYLGGDRPFYGLRSLGTDAGEQPLTSMEEIAAHHIKSIQEVQPQGPYLLAGHSFGGKVAFEMARQLGEQGEEVSLLAIMDIQVAIPEPEKDVVSWDRAQSVANLASVYGSVLGKELGVQSEALQLLDADEQLDYLHLVLKMAGQQLRSQAGARERGDLQRIVEVYKANTQANVEYQVQENPQQLPMEMILFRAESVGALGNYLPDEATTQADPTWGWSRVSSLPVRLELVPGNHFTMMAEPHVRILADRLQFFIDRVKLTAGSIK